MRKTLFVLTMILLLMLAACSTEEPLSPESDFEESIVIVSPTEDEAVLDPTEAKETEGDHDTQPSLSQTNETKETESSKTATTEKETTEMPVVSETQKDTSQVDDSSESEPSTTQTETITPPATESTAPETEPFENKPEMVTPSVERPSSSEVSSLVAVYVNQYRSSPATVLPGLSQVASYRANQLVANFAHSDGIAACNALQYGEFVDMTLYGMSESDSYYQGYNREAIAKGNWGGTADEIARQIATGFKNSSNHWKYLGSNEYSYIAVGCTYDEATSMWYCCICVSSKNYGG